MLTSIVAEDATRCVDFFEDPAGGFGFEEFRADPEDLGGWTMIGGHSAVRYPTTQEAVERAFTAVPWLHDQPRPHAALSSWAADTK